MPSNLSWLALLVTVPMAAGCSLVKVVHQNTEAIKNSSGMIATNTQAVNASATGMMTLAPGLRELRGLQRPLKQVAALDPTLRSVAALKQPMVRVAALGPSMRAVANLRTPLTGLAGLRASLDAAAALTAPMERLARLRPSLDNVASLREPMKRVASLNAQLSAVAELRDPLRRVAALEQPMRQLASVTKTLGHPWEFLLYALLGLAAWGAVTFVAVRFAIVSARRSQI